MTTGKPFQEVELLEQKPQDDGVLFPTVLSPNPSTNSTATELTAFEDAIKAHKPWLESLLLKSGAILFRGFPVISPSDFNCVVEAFGFPELSYMGGAAPRTQVVGRVYTANESRLDREIPFHHEMAYLPDPPTKLFFFCEEEPGIGGATPIVLSHIIYEKMKDKHPEFVAKLEEHGLTYMKTACDDDDPSSYAGSSWKTAFKTEEVIRRITIFAGPNPRGKHLLNPKIIHNPPESHSVSSKTDDKNIAEERAAKLGAKLKWMGNSVKMISSPLPAIRIEEESGRKTWFNSLAVAYCGPATEKIDNQNTSVEVGNGDPISDDVVKDLLKVMKEECVAIPWKKGDVLLVNNLTVLHSRQPLIKPPRHILASLCK